MWEKVDGEIESQLGNVEQSETREETNEEAMIKETERGGDTNIIIFVHTLTMDYLYGKETNM